MKLFSKALIGLALSGMVGTASAGVIKFEAAYGSDDANAAAAAFTNSTYNGITETFDDPIASYTITNETYQASGATGDQATWVVGGSAFETSVGTFTMTAPNTANNNNVRNDLLMIEDATTGEFGRNMSYDSRWLDSNDADQVTWDIIDSKYNALGFFLSDANDQGATLEFLFSNGDSSTLTFKGPGTGDGRQPNGNIAYITLFSDVAFTGVNLLFDNGEGNADGWGIDNVSLARVPEPGTLALLGLGLLGLVVARSRKAQN